MTGDAEAPSRELIEQTIAELGALDDRQFTESLADNIMEPRSEETAALRSPALAFRSYAATRALIDQTNAHLLRRTGESDKAWASRAIDFRTRVGVERRLLEVIVAGERARRGITAAPPNPTSRALRELSKNHPEEFVALKRKHKEAIVEEARARKAAQKAARRRR